MYRGVGDWDRESCKLLNIGVIVPLWARVCVCGGGGLHLIVLQMLLNMFNCFFPMFLLLLG